ncbi:MAG: DUF1501 domain-containing protein [Verrucomicrobiales bacterium]
MTPILRHWLPCGRVAPPLTRRDFLARSGYGLGALALGELLGTRSTAAEAAPVSASRTAARPGLPHFAPKAKRVIFLFMTGGFSQFESFDHKPLLKERQGEELPPSVRGGAPLLGMSNNQASVPMVGSPWPFAQHGQSGAWFSDRFPHLAQHADQLCFLKSMTSEAVNHDPALTFLQTGAQLPGRPSLGAWLDYGLGSENADLPAFITLVSKRMVDQPLSSRLWDAGFLPTRHQGVQFRAGAEPVLYLRDPQGLTRDDTRRLLDTLNDLHRLEREQSSQPDLEGKIGQYEMAYRMQMAVPEVTDLSQEPDHVKKLYGPDIDKPGSFATHCLLARRLAERGVRFIQLFHPGWDHHGSLPEGFVVGAQEVDQPAAGLLADLTARDLLRDTLVVFASEFGRTCYSQGKISKVSGSFGREHHRDCFTFWLAGGGVKPGLTYGASDEFGFHTVENPIHVNDFHATMLHLLGIHHERFTHRFQGRDYRLTDVAGKVLTPILA